MDIYCPVCGGQSHADVDFFYYFICPFCNSTFQVGSEVKLTKLEGEEEKEARSLPTCHVARKDDFSAWGPDSGMDSYTFCGDSLESKTRKDKPWVSNVQNSSQ